MALVLWEESSDPTSFWPKLMDRHPASYHKDTSMSSSSISSYSLLTNTIAGSMMSAGEWTAGSRDNLEFSHAAASPGQKRITTQYLQETL